MEQRPSLDSNEDERYMYTQSHLHQPPEVEPWAVDIRRSVEKARKPKKGILKRMCSFVRLVLSPSLSIYFPDCITRFLT